MRSQLLGPRLPDAPAYGGHSVYLFSTLDDPAEESLRTPSRILSPNSKRQKTGDGSASARPDDPITGDDPHMADSHAPPDHEDMQVDESGDREETDEEDEEDEDDAEAKYSEIPFVLPRQTFKGISNLRTIKDGTVFVGRWKMPATDDRTLGSQLCRT